MFYPNLKNLKDEKLTEYLDEDNLEQIINRLDEWLISMNEYKTYRLNPKQFAVDQNINSKIARKLFLVGDKQEVFKMFIEVRSDENEYLGEITREKYYELLEGKDLFMYSLDRDEDIEVFKHNIQIWFNLLIKPELFPSSFNDFQESEVKALSGNEYTREELDTWLS